MASIRWQGCNVWAKYSLILDAGASTPGSHAARGNQETRNVASSEWSHGKEGVRTRMCFRQSGTYCFSKYSMGTRHIIWLPRAAWEPGSDAPASHELTLARQHRVPTQSVGTSSGWFHALHGNLVNKSIIINHLLLINEPRNFSYNISAISLQLTCLLLIVIQIKIQYIAVHLHAHWES